MALQGNKDLERHLAEARQVLGLPETASFRQVQRAYHEQSRRWHPDLQDDPAAKDEATARMQHINSAYALLREFFEHYPIALRADALERAVFDPEGWWVERFGDSVWPGKK